MYYFREILSRMKRSIGRLRALVYTRPPAASTVLFFGLSFAGLLLGDGKQEAIDIYGAAIIIICWLYYRFQNKYIRRIPKHLMIPWVVFGGVSIVSLVFSDSVGFSLSWIVRFASGFLVYCLFFTTATNQSARIFIRASLLFVAGAAVLSLFSRMFPLFREFLPTMNLLDVRYGHSHLADLLVYVTPMMGGYVLYTKIPLPLLITILTAFTLTLFFTLSRGALAIVGLYVFVATLFQKPFVRIRRTMDILGITFLLVIVGIISTRAVLGEWPLTRPLTVESRFEYWRQSIEAMTQRPVLGYGPGTFSLLSKRLQHAEGRYSWFVHSFPLQLVAETGAAGLFAFLWLLGAHGIYIVKQLKKQSDGQFITAIFWSTAALFLYSTYEFVLDYHIVWLLFWGSLGLVSGAVSRNDKENIPIGITISILLVATYYFLWVISNVTNLFFHRPDLAFYSAPFDGVQTLVFIEGVSTPDRLPVGIIKFFHKQNPEITFMLGEKYYESGDKVGSLPYYKEAVYMDPHNSKYYKRYFGLLADIDAPDILGEEILNLSQVALPNRFRNQVQELIPYAVILGEYYKNWMVKENPSYKHGYAGLFYRFGISDLRDVEPMEKLLVLARDIYPDLAHLHVELASFYYHIQKNEKKYRDTLVACQRQPSAAEQCADQLAHTPYYPSEFKNVIW